MAGQVLPLHGAYAPPLAVGQNNDALVPLLATVLPYSEASAGLLKLQTDGNEYALGILPDIGIVQSYEVVAFRDQLRLCKTGAFGFLYTRREAALFAAHNLKKEPTKSFVARSDDPEEVVDRLALVEYIRRQESILSHIPELNRAFSLISRLLANWMHCSSAQTFRALPIIPWWTTAWYLCNINFATLDTATRSLADMDNHCQTLSALETPGNGGRGGIRDARMLSRQTTSRDQATRDVGSNSKRPRGKGARGGNDRCDNCDELGHYRRECPRLQNRFRDDGRVFARREPPRRDLPTRRDQPRGDRRDPPSRRDRSESRDDSDWDHRRDTVRPTFPANSRALSAGSSSAAAGRSTGSRPADGGSRDRGGGGGSAGGGGR